MINLSELTPGETAYLSLTPRVGRLAELGFIAGTRIECVAKAPLGDPIAYLVRGAVIALRRSDARELCVRKSKCP